MGYQWSNQEELKKQGVPNINSVIGTAESMDDLRTRALYLVLYVTASRIREVIRDSKKDLMSIKKKDISFIERNDRRIILIDIRNEKNKTKHRKEIPLVLDKDENIIIWKMIKEYLDMICLEDELFPFSYRYAYRLLEPYCNPHWLRHIRLTHLITVYDFNESLLSKYAGWTDSRPAKHYAELRWTDFLDKL